MSEAWPEGTALVYCEGGFRTTNGKTAHGLVRKTRRYRVGAVIDSTCAGQDAGAVLDEKHRGIPIVASIDEARAAAMAAGHAATHFVVGLAPDGGRLDERARADVGAALDRGLHVDSGLHDWLTDDPDLRRRAEASGARLRDIRKPPPREKLHFYDGRIEQVDCLRIAVLGTDSAVGKRTTSWLVVDGLGERGHAGELIGTGQTAWLQGARYGVLLDALVADFMSGELEFAIWQAWDEQKPAFVVLEGQGALMNPAYPGGLEIVAAGRPHAIVLQHAPARLEYDGFPGYPIEPIRHQIQALEILTQKPVVAITVNHERLDAEATRRACAQLEAESGLPAVDPLRGGTERLLDVLEPLLDKTRRAALEPTFKPSA